MFETIVQDVRHGIRMLVKNAGTSLIAVLSIAIGVGANTAMFSIADGLILRPLPVPDADAVITVRTTTPTGQTTMVVSYPDYADLRDGIRSFDGLAATQTLAAGLSRDAAESAQGVLGSAVTANYFEVLRVRPAMGRTFTSEEDRVPGRDAVVVLSHETWTQRFGADPGLVGREIRLSGRPFTVIGVAPEAFTGTDMFVPPAFYVPLAMLPSLTSGTAPDQLQRRDLRILRTVGRLTPGVTLAQAANEVQLLSNSLKQSYPSTNEGFAMRLERDIDARFSQLSQIAALAMMLIGLAIAVLLVACANVAGLLTSRAPVRAREIALRLAIGGSRPRLIRQLITETALVAIAGGIAGLGLGYLGIVSFRALQIPAMGVRLTYELDGRALTVGLAIAGVATLLSSLTLLEAASELGALKRLCANERFTVEANDMSAVQLLSAVGRPFVSGPAVNIYNLRSLRLLAARGLRRWVLPVELGIDALADLQAGRPEGVETEVFAFGRLPLAWSARCYTARSFNLPKDDCRFRCIEFPDGRLLQTREGEDFLVLNGIQTQSARTHEALSVYPQLGDLGVDVLRISPQAERSFEVLSLFDEARSGGDPLALREALLEFLPAGACNGYLQERPGMDHVGQQSA